MPSIEPRPTLKRRTLASIMQLAILFLLPVMYALTVLGHYPEFAMQDSERSAKLEAGKKELEGISERAKKGSKCWQAAVERLNNDCRRLDEMSKSRLAIALANCHFAMADRDTYPCPDEKSVAECTEPMSEMAFQVYTTFFVHTDNICFYLQSQVWQEHTEKTINDLTTTSKEVAKGMVATLKQSQQLLQGQGVSLSNQKEIIKNEQSLKKSLFEAREGVEQVLSSTEKQRQEFTRFFDRIVPAVTHINDWMAALVGDYMSVKTVFAYIFMLALAFVFTTSESTLSARVPVFAVWILCIIVEYGLISWETSDSQRPPNMGTVYWIQVTIRRIGFVTGLAIVVVSWYRHLGQKRKLEQLQKTVDEILKQVQQIKEERPLLSTSPNGGFKPASLQTTTAPFNMGSPSPASPMLSQPSSFHSPPQMSTLALQHPPHIQQTPSWLSGIDLPDGNPNQNSTDDSGIIITGSPEAAAVSNATDIEQPAKKSTRKQERSSTPKANRPVKSFTPGRQSHKSGPYNLRSTPQTPESPLRRNPIRQVRK